jgi:hypothetical protein
MRGVVGAVNGIETMAGLAGELLTKSCCASGVTLIYKRTPDYKIIQQKSLAKFKLSLSAVLAHIVLYQTDSRKHMNQPV